VITYSTQLADSSDFYNRPRGPDVLAKLTGMIDQNFQPTEVLTPRSFLSALTGGLLSKFS
jgi:hypothetical protein